MTRFRGPEFKRLRAEWNQKLKESGFQDIENEKGQFVDNKTRWQLERRIAVKAGMMEARRNYFIWATHALYWASFESPCDQTIWQMHSDGKSSREIGRVVKFDQKWVLEKIKRIRAYLQEQEKQCDSSNEPY